MSEINLQNSSNHVLNRHSRINNADSNYSLSAFYHESEIEQNKTIVKNAVKMIWVGIILLAAGLFLSIFTEQDLISLLPGAFIDIFSGTMIHLVNKSSESKQKYFENLTKAEHEERIIELIYESDNTVFKEEMISKLVDRHCCD